MAKSKTAKDTQRHRFDPIPKRVTTGFRVPFNHYEWTKLVDAWYSAKVQGYPSKETIVGLATHFGRCVKQVNTFYTNRRQDVSNREKDGGRKLTEDEMYELLWAKYKGTAEERRVAKQKGLSVRAASDSSSKSPSPTPSLSVSEDSRTDTASSEGSVESASSSILSVAGSDCSEWSAMITPAMTELLKVVNEKLAELEVDETTLSH
ncbi:unnamed protein product [Rhizoctonia solani]|uniref:Homeobox domain-containing protein n=1 Tax=Rhizoctonia solani TaxID=456999 RepID=A0A8H3CGQ8_9AGAM|nr:unnamed protein product [Rhizoctonia solani]